MDDRTMLELAAKAAGVNPIEIDYQDEFVWDPLTDDGDALRLAVKLHITIDRSEVKDAAYVYCDYQDTDISLVVDHGDDPYAATRRAITRAAAEIQLAKESGK